MNWSDERYVKLYTRRTATTTLWPWQARALFPWLMTAANGAGIVETGKHNRAAALAALTLLPSEVVEVGLAALLEDGTAEQLERGILLTNFVEAQNARATDAARKRSQREHERDQALESIRQDVTRRHTESHGVTHSIAQPSTAQLNQAQPSSTQLNKETIVEQARPLSASEDDEVFGHWKATLSHPRAKFDNKRRRLLALRRKEGFTTADLKQAIDGCKLTPFNMGENKEGTRHDGFGLIFRDAEHVERFMRNALSPPKPSNVVKLTNPLQPSQFTKSEDLSASF